MKYFSEFKSPCLNSGYSRLGTWEKAPQKNPKLQTKHRKWHPHETGISMVLTHVLSGTIHTVDLIQPQDFWLEMGGQKMNLHLCNRLSMITRQCEGQHTSPIEVNYFISLQLEAQVSWLVLLTLRIQTALSTAGSCCPQSFTCIRLMDHHGTYTSRA